MFNCWRLRRLRALEIRVLPEVHARVHVAFNENIGLVVRTSLYMHATAR